TRPPCVKPTTTSASGETCSWLLRAKVSRRALSDLFTHRGFGVYLPPRSRQGQTGAQKPATPNRTKCSLVRKGDGHARAWPFDTRDGPATPRRPGREVPPAWPVRRSNVLRFGVRA